MKKQGCGYHSPALVQTLRIVDRSLAYINLSPELPPIIVDTGMPDLSKKRPSGGPTGAFVDEVFSEVLFLGDLPIGDKADAEKTGDQQEQGSWLRNRRALAWNRTEIIQADHRTVTVDSEACDLIDRFGPLPAGWADSYGLC
jgi:hypothetical protein